MNEDIPGLLSSTPPEDVQDASYFQKGNMSPDIQLDPSLHQLLVQDGPSNETFTMCQSNAPNLGQHKLKMSHRWWASWTQKQCLIQLSIFIAWLNSCFTVVNECQPLNMCMNKFFQASNIRKPSEKWGRDMLVLLVRRQFCRRMDK